MTVQELIYELQQFDQDAEVRLAEQPSWPFEYSINGIVSRTEAEDGEPYPNEIVFILEGEQLKYADKDLWE